MELVKKLLDWMTKKYFQQDVVCNVKYKNSFMQMRYWLHRYFETEGSSCTIFIRFCAKNYPTYETKT